MKITRIKSLKGSCSLPVDQLSFQCALAAAVLARGESALSGDAPGGYTEHFVTCLRRLGATAEYACDKGPTFVNGRGAAALQEGINALEAPLECGGSELTVNLLAGIVAGTGGEAVLVGDDYLNQQKFGRLADALRRLGAQVELSEEGTLPLIIKGGGLCGTEIASSVPDPALKAAVLLAGMQATGVTRFTEPARSADHIERILGQCGATLQKKVSGGGRGEYSVEITPCDELQAAAFDLPGDFSRALYLVTAALLLPGSDLTITEVGLNPSRREGVKILQRMGGRIELENRRTVGGEVRGDIHVRRSKMKGVGISRGTAALIQEDIPPIVMAGALAEGETYFKDVSVLREKGTDRIAALVANLKALGLEVGESPDGLIYRGRQTLDDAVFDSFGDPLVGLACHVCALTCHGESEIRNYDVARRYWPGFTGLIESLTA